jgi:hypothetical protein
VVLVVTGSGAVVDVDLVPGCGGTVVVAVRVLLLGLGLVVLVVVLVDAVLGGVAACRAARFPVVVQAPATRPAPSRRRAWRRVRHGGSPGRVPSIPQLSASAAFRFTRRPNPTAAGTSRTGLGRSVESQDAELETSSPCTTYRWRALPLGVQAKMVMVAFGVWFTIHRAFGVTIWWPVTL